MLLGGDQGKGFDGNFSLKDKCGVGMIADTTQDDTVVNGVSYFFSLFFAYSL